MTKEIAKKQNLRNNEYYNMQEVFDDLYAKSKYKENFRFYKLIDIIKSEENIKLAYRNIKKNKGSQTGGVDKETIIELAETNISLFIEKIQNRLDNFNPLPVRRVEIPKPNGGTRPLGIPCIEDRIVQQSIKQVLEPICEGKFHNHSYGFRPNRSTHHAIARCYTLAQRVNFHYVVDIDIKGFFDNVHHGKLMKQLWSMGIQDKQVLCIISKMLKAPIQGIGVPTKGTPQGGILSPLLSNCVLNELDWWISDQWESYKTHHNFSNNSKKYRHLRTFSNLKELYVVRYADDFKIFCKDYESASKAFIAVKKWLKKRLHLDINVEKSKIVNLNNSYSEFLGFKFRVRDKGNKKTIISHVSNKAKKSMKNKLKEQIKIIQRNTTVRNVNRYNAIVLGMHNYYHIATHVSYDFANVYLGTYKCFNNRTKDIRRSSSKQDLTRCFKRYYGKYEGKKEYIREIIIFPITHVSTFKPMNFSQNICDYTEEGRKLIHDKISSVPEWKIYWIMKNPVRNKSIEYNDNRLSLFIAQKGLCGISKRELDLNFMECHHKKPTSLGGTDKYSNLILLNKDVHKLIHAKNEETIFKYLNKLNLNDTQIEKLNELRIKVGNIKITEIGI